MGRALVQRAYAVGPPIVTGHATAFPARRRMRSHSQVRGETHPCCCLFRPKARGGVLPGLLPGGGVGGLPRAVKSGHTPRFTLADHRRFLQLLSALAVGSPPGRWGGPLFMLRPRRPVPGLGGLACIANYWEHGALEARPLNMFLKNPDAVVGPGDTIVLPEFTEPWIFMHEAELALVIKGPAKMVKRDDWQTRRLRLHRHDRRVGARRGPAPGRPDSWLGKSFDTFAPIGPCIATVDEIANPNDVHRAVLGGRPAAPQLQHRRHGAPGPRARRVRDHRS